ncbi:MAG: hypothetical protein R2813_02160 [Flavobacteriales bacterium]
MNKILFVLVTSLFLFVSCRKEKNRICELYDSPVGYAIGLVDHSISVPTKTTYVYEYEVDGEQFEGNEKAYGIGQDDSWFIGKQFVVVYELADPSNSDLNIDFLIETDDDFESFLNEHQDSKLQPDYPNKCK